MDAETSGRIVIGTRGSPLAIRQTDIVIDRLQQQFPMTRIEVRTVLTTGDAIRDRPISDIGDKGVFVRSIERLLLEGEIDVAVHSLKDVPADVETAALELSAFPCREDPRDALITTNAATLDDLPTGARVGTSSTRRRVQLRKLRPDLDFRDIRGNVGTRLRKLDAGEYDAIVLAAAGLHRLGLGDRISSYFAPEVLVPDAGQGILAVQTRRGDVAAGVGHAIDDPSVRRAALAERAVVRVLGAGCHSPVGALAEFRDDRVRLLSMAASEDGQRLYRESAEGWARDSLLLGEELGRRLRDHLSE